jgi:type I restriction enzyme S subunit
MSDARKIGFMPTIISAIAEEVSRRVPTGSTLPVYSVTKHRGFVLSREYFKKQIFSRDSEGYKEVRHGEIASATIHLDEGSIGAFTDTEACLISPIYTSFKVDRTRVNPEFLVRLLKTPQYVARFATLGKGTVHRRKAIPFGRLSNLKVLLPPLPEQDRIVAILNAAEALQEKRRFAIRRLDSLRRSIFLQMFGRPGTNSSKWRISKVANAGRVQLGRQRSPRYQTGRFTRPYVRVANVFEDRINITDLLSMDFDPKDFASYHLQYGDILLNEGQSTELVGRPAMWRNEVANCCFRNTLVRFQADPKVVLPEFALEVFLHYFRNGEFARISSKTSNVAHLGATRFAEMPFPVPPLPHQKQFAQQVSKIDALRDLYRTSLEKIGTLLNSLQQRAFRGEL